MNYEIKKINDAIIFKLLEKKIDRTIAGLVKGEFTILFQTEDVKKLIIDLEEVEYCDSSGLSALLLAYRLIENLEGELRVINVRKAIQNLIEIAQLDKVLIIRNSLEEALKEFSEDK